MITLDICLSDIPNEAIKKSDKNNKLYLSLVVAERREKDPYGNTHTLFVSQSKDSRANKEPKAYVGSGKETVYTGGSSPVTNPYTTEAIINPELEVKDDDADIPF